MYGDSLRNNDGDGRNSKKSLEIYEECINVVHGSTRYRTEINKPDQGLWAPKSVLRWSASDRRPLPFLLNVYPTLAVQEKVLHGVWR